MNARTRDIDGADAMKEIAEIAIAGLLHDVGKVFQRADWPLSQTAEKLQEDLCPLVEGRAVHRHVLWTYDFCNDNLKWLAEYVDLAKIIRLATAHHSDHEKDPIAAILDEANRLASGQEQIETEELQPVIPPQVPMESILWELSRKRSSARGRAGRAEASHAAPRPEGQGQEATPREEGDPGETTTAGYFRAQVLRGDETVLPVPKRPELTEQDYRAIGTDLVGSCQKIGRTTAKPRIDWLVEALQGALERRTSLVPAYVGPGRRAVSLYGHCAATAAIASAMYRWLENQPDRQGSPADGQLTLTVVRVIGAESFVCRPAGRDGANRIYRGRVMLVRLVTRLLGDALLRKVGLLSPNRLWEGENEFVILADGSEQTIEAIRQFAAEESRRLFEQTGGYLRLAVCEPVRLACWQLGGDGWREALERVRAGIGEAAARQCREILVDGDEWQEAASIIELKDRHAQVCEPGQWAKLQEAYERQLGSSLARARFIAVYRDAVRPIGSESEPTPVGPWFVHAGSDPEGLFGWEGLERLYTVSEADEPWGWVPVWGGVPHAPTFRRADESQLRADRPPELRASGAIPRRRETPLSFEELGWLSRRSRKGRGFVGRSWLGCLRLRAEGLSDGWGALVEACDGLAEALEAGRQGQWFWHEYLEGQLRRTDRATWRVFVVRCGAGEAILVGPWNTLTMLAGRVERWWRRWVGSGRTWTMHGALAFGPRDIEIWQLVWQAEEGLWLAGQADGGEGRIWCFGRARTWGSYRQGLMLARLLDEQLEWPGLQRDEAGIVFLRRLALREAEAHRAAQAAKGGQDQAHAAWRSHLAQDVRKLILKRLPGRSKRTESQEELIGRLRRLMIGGKRSRLAGSVGIAARVALWQNLGEAS